MCGICGKLNFDIDARVAPERVAAMLDTIRHRGPDDDGIYVNGNVGLGHRRLSIIDLSTGHQPLSNEDGTIWIVFNGEIYNFHELRRFLVSRGHVFRTQTDTEAIVHLYEEYGVECIQKLRGMFAFALWDEKAQTLLIARDRVGIKPLYYCLTGRFLSFASEIKALLADPGVSREMSPEIIDRFFTFAYLPGQETLLKDVRKLAPGHYLVVRHGRPEVRQYWDLHFPPQKDRVSPADAEKQLIELLGETVEMHMIADVPVGLLLSGGLDSTAVLSFAVERTDKPISSFTVGFSDSGIADERPYARIAARAFGTEHHEMTITPRDFASFMPQYVWYMEEPVCEPPAVAMYYVSKLAREHVKVLLSGEGGDEAFAGYSNYRNIFWLERVKRILAPLNGTAARGLNAAGAMVGSARLNKYLPLMEAHFPNYYLSRTVSPERVAEGGFQGMYSRQFSSTLDRERTVAPVRQLQANVQGHSTIDAMLYIDTKSWLPDDLLIKADKMTMANSLELRVPLLDHKLLEFAATLPSDLKVNGFTTKYIAKRALSKRVPEPIVNRRKAGFPVPYGSWFRNDLRSWVNDVLFDRKTTNRGYFDTAAVRRLVDQGSARAGWSKDIFSLVTLELWHRAFVDAGQN